MLKLIWHFPIEAVDGLINLTKAKKSSSKRRRRREITRNFHVSWKIVVIILILLVAIPLAWYAIHQCRKKPSAMPADGTDRRQTGSADIELGQLPQQNVPQHPPSSYSGAQPTAAEGGSYSREAIDDDDGIREVESAAYVGGNIWGRP